MFRNVNRERAESDRRRIGERVGCITRRHTVIVNAEMAICTVERRLVSRFAIRFRIHWPGDFRMSIRALVSIQVVHFHREARCSSHAVSHSPPLLSVSFCSSILPSSNERSLAPHTAFEASLAGIVLATRIPTRGKSYRDTRCASEICDRVNDAGTAAI